MKQSKRLSLVELLNLANEVYDDGCLAEYFDSDTGTPRAGSGDTLAEFIVREIHDTLTRTPVAVRNSTKPGAFS